MNLAEFRLDVMKFKWIFSTCTPIDTGNLRYNAVQSRFHGQKECRIYVDTDIAPYMPYTNEKWVSPKWNGKANPNEGWFKKAIETAIASVYGNRATILYNGSPTELSVFSSPTQYKPKRTNVYIYINGAKKKVVLRNFKPKFSKREKKQ